MLRRRRSAQAHLVEIVSPRQLEEGELAARGLFAGLAGGEPCSLEIAVAGDGPRHYIRASSAEALGEAVAQLAAAYPQAEVEPIALSERPDLDPLRLGRIEYAEAVEPSPRDSALTLNTDLRGTPRCARGRAGGRSRGGGAGPALPPAAGARSAAVRLGGAAALARRVASRLARGRSARPDRRPATPTGPPGSGRRRSHRLPLVRAGALARARRCRRRGRRRPAVRGVRGRAACPRAGAALRATGRAEAGRPVARGAPACRRDRSAPGRPQTAARTRHARRRRLPRLRRLIRRRPPAA